MKSIFLELGGKEKALMTNKEYIRFGAPRFSEDEINEVVSTMRSGWIGTGPKVANFENNFAKFKGMKNAIALNSCTAALHLSMVALGLKEGDEVITSPLTFCATINAIIHAGATPVIADVNPLTMNIEPVEILKKITTKTRCILPIHLTGRPCEMDEIMMIARDNNLLVVEDCAHAVESEYKGQKIGSFGDIGCFSFYVTKNLCVGEGGMIVTNKSEIASKIKISALHGMTKDAWHRFSDSGYQHYGVETAGFKYNMTDIQASIGLHQLANIDENWKKRKIVFDRYMSAFKNLPIGLPLEQEPHSKNAFHLFTILIDKNNSGLSRDEFLLELHKEGIGAGVHYLSLNEHPYYQNKFGWSIQDCPNAVSIGRQTVSLPMSQYLNEEEITKIIDVVCNLFEKTR